MSKFAVQGAWIIKSPHEVEEHAFVIVEGSTIAGIVPELPDDVEFVLGSPHDIVMPGFINTHTHAAMTMFRGLADDLPLMTWLNDHIFPAEARYVNEDFVYLGSLLAAWEMVRSGTTSFCDGYFFEDQVGEAAREVGIRAWIGEGILQYPTPSNPNPARTIDHTREFIARWEDDPLVRPTVFPHAVYTCTPELLRESAELAREKGLVFQIHLSETRGEVDRIREEYHLSPVELLDSLGCLGQNTLAAHCVAVSDEDIALLSKRGVSVSHNAESNMKLSSGIAPVPRMLEKGVNVALGTDGCASNNNLDMIGELSTAAKLHKVATLDPTVLDAATALGLATVNGARALNFAGGRLDVDRPADIVVLDGDSPNLVPVHHPVSHVVYAATGPNVKDVVIDGRVVVQDHRATTIDEEALLKECRAYCAHIVNKG